MIQSGITTLQLKSMQANDCNCQLHRGDGLERDLDAFNDRYPADHDPLSKAENKASIGSERSRADYSRRRREIAALVAQSMQDDAATEVTPIHEHGTIPIWTEEAILDRLDAERVVNLSLVRLTAREEQLVRLTYGIGNYAEEQLEEIGKRLGLSRGRVWQIRQKAERRLRYPIKTFEEDIFGYDARLVKRARYLRNPEISKSLSHEHRVACHHFACELRNLAGFPAVPNPDWVIDQKPVRKNNIRTQRSWDSSLGHFDAPDSLTGPIPTRYNTPHRIPWEEGYVRASEVVEKEAHKPKPTNDRPPQTKRAGGFVRKLIGGMLDIVKRQQS